MEFKKIMIFLSTDEYPSPFDIQMMYDAGADHAICYGKVDSKKAKQLILDAMFPRGPEGVVHTGMFIGGTDVDECLAIAKVAKETMFPPFQISTIVDPQGGYTTASALVAKVEHCIKEKFGLDVSQATVAIVGGAGRVGSNAALLLAKDGAKVRIVDVLLDVARKKRDEINEAIGGERVEVFEEEPRSPEVLERALKGADIIITTGPPGLQLVPKSVLEKLSDCKVVADVNAVPPLGIEGLKSSKDCKPILGNIHGIGALAIGPLKNQVEMALIKRALNEPSGFFELEEMHKVAKDILGL
ncbi:MAG: hypothetical protein J7L91_01515 [Candidatus Korarchaeota archaeon]|nr:hypothetical protein [Candidatus Korarchaeota archaeon]